MGTLTQAFNLETKVIDIMHLKHGIVTTTQARVRFDKLYTQKHGRPKFDKNNPCQYNVKVGLKAYTMARYFGINYGMGREVKTK